MPLIVALPPILTAPGTTQNTLLARAPPERNTLVLPACVRVLPTWKTQADAKKEKSQHIGEGASEVVRTVCRTARDCAGGWNTDCTRILVDTRSEGEARKVA